ncbi:protein shifted isoform X2 [Eurytemora carolleeae]|uniref:protein shifted isoform X2 n=1 Tax=Eurytemora carolleeae TaxID=1294199 RepID=UPI000C767805|nr:protein shifted isoform X2 [Eurytemora carolleeae]|eukprot:XP_023341244.1 protein shifted-like isoform X2 [Eurytemora affinis]
MNFIIIITGYMLLVGGVQGSVNQSEPETSSRRRNRRIKNIKQNTINSFPIYKSRTDDFSGIIQPVEDLSIWIDEEQVSLFAGIQHIIIHVVANGLVMPHLLDRNLETHLPVIPAEIEEIKFRWSGGEMKYRYNFYRLESHDHDLLLHPRLNIPARGKIPKRAGEFSVKLLCTGNLTGIASFSVGLEIFSRRKRLAGTPLKLRLRKECLAFGRDTLCDRKCGGRGECDSAGECVCRTGWEGDDCRTPVCSPQCMHGGFCSSPGVCDCPAGFQGPSCEGGVCTESCLNKGRCIEKDTCRCKPGFYGRRCEFSKCVVPCLNGGVCKGVNRCRCEPGFAGHHCQLLLDDDTDSGLCSPESCESIKSCRNTHCSFISRRNRSERRACKMTHCASLLTCDVDSCNRKLKKSRSQEIEGF